MSTRASSAATKSRALLAQGSKRSSPHVPLLQLPSPPREASRLPPSRRKKHGFTIGRGRPRSPSIEPDYDEDDAWWDTLAEDSKESLSAIPVMTSNETNQRVALSGEASGSNVDPADAPQDDHHDTSSSSGVERSGEASGSNAGTTDAPEGEASGSNSGAPGAPQDDRRSTMSTSTPMVVENIPPARRETTGDRLQQRRERMTAAVL